MKKGFTLIEILVTMAIIGVVAAGALTLINPSAQFKKANDARRKADLAKIQAGLELYRADQDSYPSSLPSCGGDLVAGTTYIKSIPCDPTTSSSYLYTPSGSPVSSYTLVACLENLQDSQKDPVNTCGTGLASYTAVNP